MAAGLVRCSKKSVEVRFAKTRGTRAPGQHDSFQQALLSQAVNKAKPSIEPLRCNSSRDDPFTAGLQIDRRDYWGRLVSKDCQFSGPF